MENIVYKNSLSKSRTSNFYVEAPMPLDARLVVKNVDVLYDYNNFSGNLYEGMIVSVLEPFPQTYRLVRKDDINTGNKIGAAFIDKEDDPENYLEENKKLWERIDINTETIISEISISEYDYSISHEDENRLYAGAEIKLKNSAGEVIAKDTMYGASDTYPGLMSMKKFKQVNAHEEALKVFGDSVETITWDHTCNMNNYKTAGTYRIKGERTGNPMTNPETDNLPIMNQGSGNTIDGILYVFDSSLTNGSGEQYDCTVTQFLMLSNRVGGQEGDMYMRSGYGANKDNLTWKPWEKYQTNMEVGVVSNDATHESKAPFNPISANGLNSFVDNGIYSGVYLTQEVLGGDLTKAETFVMITINNYAAAGDNKTITQIKFAVNNIGVFSMEKRNTLTVESTDLTDTVTTLTPTGTTTEPTTSTPAPTRTLIWSDWELVNNNVDQQLDGYSKNAISNAAVYQQFYEHQEEIAKCATKDNLVQGLDWEANTTKEFHIKNRTHHMKEYMCMYFKGSPISISKPSDTGYVVIAYDTDGDAKYLKVEIKANEYKTEEFLDAMGLPIIFTWDNGASTINVQSFGGALENLSMRAYYSSSATSFDDYFVKLDEGFLPSSLIADYNKLKDDYNKLKDDYTALNNRLTVIENKLNWNEVNGN